MKELNSTRVTILLVTILLFLIVAACSDKAQLDVNTVVSPPEDTDNISENEESPFADYGINEAEVDELAAQFGEDIPLKVVSVSVAIAEMLDVLDVMPVGVPTSAVPLPEAFSEVQQIGSSLKPDIEQITALQPDLVLGPSSIKDSLEKTLSPASLPTVYIPTDSLDELKLSLAVLGQVFQQEEKAITLLESLEQSESNALSLANGETSPKVMFLFGSAESFMLMNVKTFPGSIAQMLGASNVVSDVLKSEETYIPLDLESVIMANPDIIMLVSHGDPVAALEFFEEDVKKNGAWEKLNAFKNDKVFALDYNVFGVASIVKAPDAFKQLSEILYH